MYLVTSSKSLTNDQVAVYSREVRIEYVNTRVMVWGQQWAEGFAYYKLVQFQCVICAPQAKLDKICRNRIIFSSCFSGRK